MSEILAPARISDIFLYYGFDNGYVLTRLYGHTGLYGNHHPVKPSMIFFIFHSLPPPSRVRLDVRTSAWYSSLFTFPSLTGEAGCEDFLMVFFTFHSLPPPSQVKLDVRTSAWYSSLFAFHFSL